MTNNFTCQWINRQDERGFTNFDVIITHDEGTIPPKRISRNWKIEPEAVTETFLGNDAATLVDQIIVEWNLSQEVTE